AKNLATAADNAHVHHVIWSTLEDTRALMHDEDERMPKLQTKYRVPHFDAKGEADRHFEHLRSTYLVTSFYWDNLYKSGLAPKKGADGVYRWAFPMGEARLAGVAAEDIGKVAYGIFKAGDAYVGQRVGVAAEHLTIEEMGKKLSHAFGLGPVVYQAMDPDDY